MAQNDKKTDDTASASAAVDEVLDPKAFIVVGFNGKTYTIKRKRLDTVQFRGSMQKNQDVVALEFLLGPQQYQEFLEFNSDEDGTSVEVFTEFWEQIGEAITTGNS